MLSYVYWNLYDREKSFPLEKAYRYRYFLFYFKCFICDFSNFFIFYNSVWIRIRIRIRTFFWIRILPKLTDSSGFGFGTTTLTVYL
jgi:hypothetical protein